MTTQSHATSWMWLDEATGQVQGATLDKERLVIEWVDSPGCACDDSPDEQTIADFLANGPRYLRPPADVLAEMRLALAARLHA